MIIDMENVSKLDEDASDLMNAILEKQSVVANCHIGFGVSLQPMPKPDPDGITRCSITACPDENMRLNGIDQKNEADKIVAAWQHVIDEWKKANGLNELDVFTWRFFTLPHQELRLGVMWKGRVMAQNGYAYDVERSASPWFLVGEPGEKSGYEIVDRLGNLNDMKLIEQNEIDLYEKHDFVVIHETHPEINGAWVLPGRARSKKIINRKAYEDAERAQQKYNEAKHVLMRVNAGDLNAYRP